MSERFGMCIRKGYCNNADAGYILRVRSSDPFRCPMAGCNAPLDEVTSPEHGSPSKVHATPNFETISSLDEEKTWRERLAVIGTLVVAAVAVIGIAHRPDPKCASTNWATADAATVMSMDCKGKGFPKYEQRLLYVQRLEAILDWQNVRLTDPVLNDCAGISACTNRSNERQPISPPIPPSMVASGKSSHKQPLPTTSFKPAPIPVKPTPIRPALFSTGVFAVYSHGHPLADGQTFSTHDATLGRLKPGDLAWEFSTPPNNLEAGTAIRWHFDDDPVGPPIELTQDRLQGVQSYPDLASPGRWSIWLVSPSGQSIKLFHFTITR